MRTRLTLAVGVVAGSFLALSAYLFSARATDNVLAGVRADQVSFVANAAAGSVGSPGALVPAAVDTYRRLDSAGRLDELYRVIGVRPDPSQGVYVADGMTAVHVAGPVGAPDGSDGFTMPADIVLQIGGSLLDGIAPADLMIVNQEVDRPPLGQSVGDGLTVSVPAAGPGTGAGPLLSGSGGGPAGGSTVIVGAIPITNVRSSVNDLSRNLWIGAGLLTVVAMVATWLLTGRALRPVAAITDRVQAITAAGSRERVPVPATDDEIGHLARTVNTMLDRLGRASVTQQRFVADASHELRSPLAAIRAETEVALGHPDTADWSLVAHTVLHETGRLEELVTDLLVLARREEPTAEATAPAVCTDVEEVALAEAARSRRVVVDTSRVLAGRVAAQPGDIVRVVRHLLDNAARHATDRVAIAVNVDAAHVLIVVDDDGAGVPTADRSRIFERFTRLDDARSRDEGGAGLGLAVVATVVNAIGGTVTVEDAPTGGARFVVRLPGASVDRADDDDDPDPAAPGSGAPGVGAGGT